MKNFALAAVLLIFASPAFANSVPLSDSLTIGVSSGLISLTPGVDQLLTIGRVGSAGDLEFVVGPLQPGPYTLSMSWTLLVPNQAPQVLDFSGSCYPAGNTCGWVSSFLVPISYRPVPFTLTVDVTVGSTTVTETFDEHYVSPAPEPASLLLFMTGGAFVAWRKYRTS